MLRLTLTSMIPNLAAMRTKAQAQALPPLQAQAQAQATDAGGKREAVVYGRGAIAKAESFSKKTDQALKTTCQVFGQPGHSHPPTLMTF